MRQLPELKKAKLELELEGDFGDLYLNCNELLLLSCVKIDTKLAKFSDPSFLSIKTLISCSMQHSYFLEPTGTYRTLKGFSMGDFSAAHGSEFILRVHEFEIGKKLFSLKLQ